MRPTRFPGCSAILILVAGGAIAGEPPTAAPTDNSERLRQIEVELRDLRQELIVERTARAEERTARAEERTRAAQNEARIAEEATRRADEAARRVAGELGLVRAGPVALLFSGYIQADAALYRQDSLDEVDPSTGQPLNETRFLIRRAHLRADLDWRFLSGALELEGSTVGAPNVRLFAAEASIRWAPAATAAAPAPQPWLMLSAGLLRIPFGFENQEKDSARLFLERSQLIRALFPGENDLGVRLAGGWRFLRYQVAAMNGHPIGEAQFPALDPTQSKDLLGRLGVDVGLGALVQLRAGFSGLYGTGFHKGSPATKDVLTWRDENGDGLVQPSELQVIAGSAAAPSQTFNRAALGADLGLMVRVPRLGMLTIYGELVSSTNLDRGLAIADPIGAGRDLRELGYYVGISQELTPWAMIGLRYDRYDPDADAGLQLGARRVPVDDAYATIAVAAAAQYAPYGRLTLEYDHNTNPLGRTLAGAPTTLGSDAVTVRAQLAF